MGAAHFEAAPVIILETLLRAAAKQPIGLRRRCSQLSHLRFVGERLGICR